MPTLAEEWLNEGLTRGEAGGLRKVLRRLLVKRFKQALTSEQEARIDAAPLEDLERFVDRVLSEESIDAVLGP